MTTSTSPRLLRSSRHVWPVVLLVVGAALAGAALAGSDLPAAAVSLVLFPAWAYVVWRMPDSDVVHDVLQLGSDERDRRVAVESAALAHGVLTLVLVGGFVVELVRGSTGTFTALASLDGVLSLGASLWVRRRV